jgi:hypothetical protein
MKPVRIFSAHLLNHFFHLVNLEDGLFLITIEVVEHASFKTHMHIQMLYILMKMSDSNASNKLTKLIIYILQRKPGLAVPL